MKNRDTAGARITVSHTLKSGKTITLSTFSRRNYLSSAEESLRYYRRQWIQTWTDNIDLVPADIRERKLEEAFAKASAMSLEDLPRKVVKLPMRNKDGTFKTNGDGEPVLRDASVDYSSWWASQTEEGRTFNIWQSMKHDTSQSMVTLDEVRQMFEDEYDLESAAQAAGEVSASKLGNSSSPRTEGRRRRRRR